jgi:monoterpene epsilon-lactone hydrolase
VDGVYTDIVTPANGVPEKNKNRVLINLHGGGFVFGARTIAMMESIPIASVAQMKVVTVDYRQGPENHFPAASEDVATVYRALLKQYKPGNIGIFGCSAGGMLTGEALVWFQAHDLPRPGAAGMFCAGAGHTLEGDSRYASAALNGQIPPPPSTPDKPGTMPLVYFDGADPKDPLVTPLESPKMMARFPPMLLVTATRDIAMSPVITTHQTLVRLGVDAELHVWDGLQHSFFTDIDLPESKEYFMVVGRFFDKHLGR